MLIGMAKAHTRIGLADRDEGGVDADEIATQVDHAEIDRGIGLDEILIRPEPDIGPVQAAERPRRSRSGRSSADCPRN
jgi:hypothetical protein